MTLTEFLLARIAEDEAAATNASHHSHLAHDYERDNYGFLWVKTTRVLAECEAKRRLIQAHETNCCGYHDWPIEGVAPGRADRAGVDVGLWHAIRLAALPHADHPDYRDEWRP